MTDQPANPRRHDRRASMRIMGGAMGALAVPPGTTAESSASAEPGTVLAAPGGESLQQGEAATSIDHVRMDLASDAGASLIGYSASSAQALARTIQDRLQESVSVMDFIPEAYHRSIAAGTNTQDLTGAFQTAAAAARSLIGDSSMRATVRVPNGRYHVSTVGIRDVVFRGESTGGTEIRAASRGAGNMFMFDAMLDADGKSRNTYGGGWVENLTIDARLANGARSGRSGLRTYGGGQNPNRIICRHAETGFAIGLPIWSVASNLLASECTTGISTFHASRNDNGTSTTFIACWANACRRFGFHVKQLYYSSFINCVAQACGSRGFFVEGDGDHTAAYSLQFLGCATEGAGTPFYFRRCRDLTLINPRIIAASANVDFITFDDSQGSIRDFSTLSTPGRGRYHLAVRNHGSGDGSILVDNSRLTYDPANEHALVIVGGWTNEVSKIQGFRFDWNDPNPTDRCHASVGDIGGYRGLRFVASDGTRLMALSRLGAPIFSTAGHARLPSSALQEGDVSFGASGDNLRFVVRGADGRVRSYTLTPDR